MKPEEITRDMLTVGCSVGILTRTRKDRRLVKGLVSEILTSSNTHPHGILVRIQSGEEGRVQELTDRVDSGEVDRNSSDFGGSITDSEVEELINCGESHFIEYKESLLWSQDLSPEELRSVSNETKRYGRDASKVILAKVIASFLNSDGGSLVIGLRENKDSAENNVIGIENEYSKLKDKCEDGYRRLIVDSILNVYFPESIFNRFSDYFRIEFYQTDEKTLCIIRVYKSNEPVFLSIGRNKLFFIRVDASVRQLQDESILSYYRSRYPDEN